MRATLRELGDAGNQGWRERVADAVAPRLARRTPAREDDVRAAVGLLFLGLSVYYIAAAIKSFRSTSQ